MLAGHGSPMLGSARRCESRIGSAQTSYPTLRRRGRYRHLHLLFKTFKFGGCPIHKHQPSITEGCFYIILTGVVRVLCISMFGQIRCADRGSSLEILRVIFSHHLAIYNWSALSRRIEVASTGTENKRLHHVRKLHRSSFLAIVVLGGTVMAQKTTPMSDWLKCYVLCSKMEASTHANVRNVRFSIQNAWFLAGACSGACYHLKEKTFFLFKTTTSTRTSTHQKTRPFTIPNVQLWYLGG